MKTLVFVALAALSVPAMAQMDHANCPMAKGQKTAAAAPQETSPYTSHAGLKIKALTPETIEQYRKGTGMGLAIPAELNGYPGPRHVLDLGVEISLTSEQRAKMEELFESMRTAAVRLGEEIIALESKLDAGFASGTMTRVELQALTNEIASRQGKLRFTHLETHIAAKAILSAPQIAAYNKARGY